MHFRGLSLLFPSTEGYIAVSKVEVLIFPHSDLLKFSHHIGEYAHLHSHQSNFGPSATNKIPTRIHEKGTHILEDIVSDV